MAFCKNCGKEIDENDVFCPKCGTSQVSGVTNTKSSGENVNLCALFSFLCAILLLFMPMIQRTLILIVGTVGVALGLTAMIK